jgi:hypothetical protein
MSMTISAVRFRSSVTRCGVLARLIGRVGINQVCPVALAYHAGGAGKRAGFGDPAFDGGEAVAFYTRGKAILARWSA